MTRITGYAIIVSPCCKSLYTTPRYGSMNFSAQEYWTDGYEEHSLMPNDGGLRKCQCGAFYLLRDAVGLGIEAGTEIPFALHVRPDELPDAIMTASSPALEATARRSYWWELNSSYRSVYRSHRQEVNAEVDAQWRQDFRASLSPLKRIVHDWTRGEPKKNFPKRQRPFTMPPYRPSTEQKDNMERLLALILNGAEDPMQPDPLEVTELYRELGEFKAAAATLSSCNYQDEQALKSVLVRLVDEGATAPVRYRA